MNDYRTTNDLGETRTWEELYEDNLLFNKAYKDLKQENKQLKNILIELEEWLKEHKNLYEGNEFQNNAKFCMTVVQVLDKIQELKEKYK